jgi:hypothetical protein
MNPAFPDIVGQWAANSIDHKAQVWCATLGVDGCLEERLERSILATLDELSPIEEIIDALVIAAAELDISDTRLW